VSQNDLISISALIEQLRGEGLTAGDDSLQRLRDEALIDKPKSQGRLGSAYTSPQVARINNILQIQKQLGPKWSYPELAFWMAANKMRDVPTGLIAEHIEGSIERFIQIIKRLTDRSARGRKMPGDSPARRMARHAVRQMARARDESSRQAAVIAEGCLELCLSLWYFKIPPSDANRILRRIVYEVYDRSVADDQFRIWQERLAVHVTVFSDNVQTNRLRADVQSALRKKPDLITRATRDALLGYTLIKTGLEEAPGAPLRLSSSSAYLYTRLARTVVPMLAAISIDVQLDNSRNPILLRLRQGDDFNIREFFRNSFLQIPLKVSSQ
jgi:hypothetical protein